MVANSLIGLIILIVLAFLWIVSYSIYWNVRHSGYHIRYFPARTYGWQVYKDDTFQGSFAFEGNAWAEVKRLKDAEIAEKKYEEYVVLKKETKK
jgi:hypothetical protein